MSHEINCPRRLQKTVWNRWVSLLLCTLSCVSLWVGQAAYAGAYDQFFQAIEKNDAATVSSLLAQGFVVNTPDAKGNPPLVLALQNQASSVVSVLMSVEETDWDAPNANGETALMMAALKGNLPVVRELVQRGCAVNRQGWTPLHYAATAGYSDVIHFLLARQAQVDTPSPNGTTALMMAAMYGSLDAVKVLLDQGQADFTLRNDKNLRAVDFAKQANRPDIVDWLQRWEQMAMSPSMVDADNLGQAHITSASAPASMPISTPTIFASAGSIPAVSSSHPTLVVPVVPVASAASAVLASPLMLLETQSALAAKVPVVSSSAVPPLGSGSASGSDTTKAKDENSLERSQKEIKQGLADQNKDEADEEENEHEDKGQGQSKSQQGETR
jgi:hypothetical protein